MQSAARRVSALAQQLARAVAVLLQEGEDVLRRHARHIVRRYRLAPAACMSAELHHTAFDSDSRCEGPASTTGAQTLVSTLNRLRWQCANVASTLKCSMQ
jgi:hypothetical protein